VVARPTLPRYAHPLPSLPDFFPPGFVLIIPLRFFQFLPIIGQKIKDVLEDKLEPKLAEMWRWRPEQKKVPNYSLPDTPDVDLSEARGWRRDSML